jgi:hypothetical protein
MGAEWVAVVIVMAGGALFVGFPAGVGFGYMWRARISRMRRLQAAEEWRRGEIDRELALIAAQHLECSKVNSAHDVIAESRDTSDRAVVKVIGKDTMRRARGKVSSSEEIKNRTARDGKERKAPRKVKLRVTTANVVQEPAPGGAA